MASSRLAWCACLLAAPLCAGTINVSADSSVSLQPGDTLTFNVSAWSYLVQASQFGAPADPTYVSFSLLTDPLLASLELAVSLQSYSGSASAPVTALKQSSGYFLGSLYQGPVSLESGGMELSPALSSQLFSGPALLLSVEDLSGSATLDLAPYSVLQTLEVSLSGGSLTTGGYVAAANLKTAPSLSVMAEPLDSLESLDTPEPPYAPVLSLGAACLFLPALSKRLRLKRCPISRTRG